MSERELTRLAELRQAYLRHLPQRLQALAARLRRYTDHGWDVAGLALLHEDIQRLAGASGRYGLVDASERLLAVEGLLGDLRRRNALPDAEAQAQLRTRIDELVARTPADGDGTAAPSAVAAETPASAGGEASAAGAAVEGPPPRILIVEDDRSEALYAEGILGNAGMRTQVVTSPDTLIDALTDFRPDLVLMDLYMPTTDGMTLTARIRESDDFLHLPIVFLSGESDPDKQFEALDAGGDDFLAKPVRARHLIAAVNTRVRRARALARRNQAAAPVRDPQTGLYQRCALLEHIDAALAGRLASTASGDGGVLFLELTGAPQLRDRAGVQVFERIADEIGRVATRILGERPATRWGDGLLAYSDTGDESALLALAATLRDAVAAHPLPEAAGPALRATVGVCALAHRFSDPGSLLDAVERAARTARSAPGGLAAFQPVQTAAEARESALLARIREAVDGDGFELIYQPIVAVAGGGQPQYQALLRLRELDGKVYPAAEVVPLAERSGLLPEIDRWVVDRALLAIRSRAQGGEAPHLFVSQSPLTLAADDHAAWMEARLREGDGVRGLTIDLRLDAVMPYLDLVEAFCRRLAPAGVCFCLSQFEAGIGESLLQRLPLAFVRLAPRYAEAALSTGTRDELKRLIDAAHQRGVKVIGQRVEDARSAATLWMSGIDYLQGHLVQAPGSELGFDFHHAVL
ncbi:EAL domain-containing protein [Coralloluteibacterium thermophilus]|uniref:EAL domain-containing protein n=1 Tax=Coralloluteibacterium thermophilum TaxID=2707049 RepID=A0ABV9NFU5_9GAMM